MKKMGRPLKKVNGSYTVITLDESSSEEKEPIVANKKILLEMKEQCKNVLAETISVRKILLDIDEKGTLLGLDLKEEELGKKCEHENCLPKILFGDEKPTGKVIRSGTDAQEQELLLQEFQAILKAPEVSTTSMGTQNCVRIKQERAVAALDTVASGFGLSVNIGNYLKHSVQEIQCTLQTVGRLDLPQFIEAGSRQSLAFWEPSHLNGLLSFSLGCHKLRLVVWLEQSIDFLATALIPKDLPVGNHVFDFEGVCRTRPSLWRTMCDKRWVTGGKEPVYTLIRNRSIQVRVKFTGGSKSSLDIDILKTEEDYDSVPKVRKSKRSLEVTDGRTIWKKTIDGILEYVLGNFGYVIEFVNLLTEPLYDPVWYLENGERPFSSPDFVAACSREIAIIKVPCSGRGKGGFLALRFGATDLRLAVAFQLFNNGNKIGAAFIPAGTPANSDLMQFITSDNQWRTSPDQSFIAARDGEIVIEARNVRAKLTMTDSMKAAVKIIIKTI